MLDPSGWQLHFTRGVGDRGTLCSSLHKSERLAAPSLFLWTPAALFKGGPVEHLLESRLEKSLEESEL